MDTSLQNGVTEALPLLDPGDIVFSCALDISADGRRIIGTQTHDDTLASDGLLWEDGVPRLLETLSGFTSLSLTGMSADGETVIGQTVGPGQTFHAVIWDDANGTRDFMQVLLAAGVDLHGWRSFDELRDISADGRTVLGYGFNAQGEYAPFVATIPEPGTLSLAAASFVLVGLRRGRGRADSIHPGGAFESSHGASPW